MLAGVLYDAAAPELVAERRCAQLLLARYNATGPNDAITRDALLGELFGAIGDGANIHLRFCCDYGYNISKEPMVSGGYLAISVQIPSSPPSCHRAYSSRGFAFVRLGIDVRTEGTLLSRVLLPRERAADRPR